MALTGQEPVGFKLGHTAHFPKPGAGSDSIDKQRSITLSNTIAKHYYKFLRAAGSHLVANLYRDSQYGGRAPWVLLWAARMRTYARLMDKAPPGLRTLVRAAYSAPRSWLASISADMQWFHERTPVG